MWQFIRALPPPDDANAVILTFAFVAQMKADQVAEFAGTPTLGAALDPAFTEAGDDAILRFAQWGVCTDGIWRIEYLDAMKIPVTAAEEQDAFYRVAEKVIKVCKQRGVQPNNFGVDVSGSGMGIQSVFVREWSPRVHPCNSSGKPTKLKVTAKPTTHDLAAKRVHGVDVFDRRVSEIYFSLRHFVEAGQVRGLHGANEIIVEEASQRRYFVDNGKLSVISKRTLYQKHNSSDHLDAACVLIDLIKHKGLLPHGTMHNAVPARQQVEQEAIAQADRIPDMVGPRSDRNSQHAIDLLRRSVQHSTGADDDFAFDEGGISGY
jgi:hypothetical protein